MEPEEIIEGNLASPRKAASDAGSVEQHSLPDQIAAAEWLARNRAAVNPIASITRAVISPGSVY